MIAAHDESWGVLTTLLPAEWQMVAFTSGAVSRLRGFDNVASLLRTLLMHVGNGYSLRETATRAKAAGLASVSDVALLERLRSAGPWWRYLCASLLEESGVHVPTPPGGRVFRAVDGNQRAWEDRKFLAHPLHSATARSGMRSLRDHARAG